MSNFTPLVKKEYEFEGDTIRVTFSRLKRKHMLSAMPLLAKLTKAKEAEDDEAVAELMGQILDTIVDVIPEYVQEFSGLNDAAGETVSIEAVIDNFYFMKLCMNMSLDMLNESSAIVGNE